MRRSLTWKLSLSFLLVAVTVAALVAVFIRLFSAEMLDQLIVEQQRNQFREFVVSYYQTHGSWAGVRAALAESGIAPFPGPGTGGPGSGGGPPGPRYDRRGLFGLADARGVVVIPHFHNLPAGQRLPQAALAQGETIEVDGQVIGTILTAPARPGLNPEETAYLRRTNLALLLASGGAVLAALVFGVLLARTLIRPLQALTQATHRMAGGELEQEVAVQSADEIGELATAFNRMSRQVARANNARRQMTADVAHELRTPLTVVAGYVESMRDGVLAPNPERLAVIYTEIERLQQLVGDLRTLTQADSGELKLNQQSLAPGELIQQAAVTFEHQARQKGIRLELDAKADLPPIRADEARMAQVMGNLIGNALRYTPPDGQIVLGAARQGARVRLTVRDTGQGIAPGDLPFIFDRFYRAEKSRVQENGESGLGLAIARAIVEAHGGTIEASSTPGAGTTFTILLPAAGT
jgi:signal transduction histidine kinase